MPAELLFQAVGEKDNTPLTKNRLNPRSRFNGGSRTSQPGSQGTDLLVSCPCWYTLPRGRVRHADRAAEQSLTQRAAKAAPTLQADLGILPHMALQWFYWATAYFLVKSLPPRNSDRVFFWQETIKIMCKSGPGLEKDRLRVTQPKKIVVPK